MSVTIGNEKLTARIADMGAELKGLRENGTGREYIWQSDPAYWTGAAPILFPIIGGLKNNEYRFEGRTYSMPSHGLVRKKEWEKTGDAPLFPDSGLSDGKAAARNRGASPVFPVSPVFSSASYHTASNAETREMYPFDFDLKVTYTLVDCSLVVRYDVTNTGKATMWFSIGSHPAINVPFAGGYPEHYYFHFSAPENMERYFFSGGCHLNETAPAFDNNRQIFLTPTLFDRGPLIFKNPASKSVTIMNSRNTKRVRLRTEGVPFIALWAPPGAPLACIEPWHGIPDPIDTDGEFTTKEGIMSLAGGATYTTGYAIDILDGGGV